MWLWLWLPLPLQGRGLGGEGAARIDAPTLLLYHAAIVYNSGAAKQVILSVKGGHTDVTHVRDLRGVLDREKAQIGVLISMQDPTGPMKTEAASAGFYASPWNPAKPHPRLQILTIRELLDGKRIDMPPPGQVNVTFQRAPRVRIEASGPGHLPLLGDEG